MPQLRRLCLVVSILSRSSARNGFMWRVTCPVPHPQR
jgi:hypothetical protein